MSIWTRIADALGALAQGASLATVLEKLRTPPERSIGFTIAVIALGAKMAKADGAVTRDEVAAFREVFHIPPSELANAAKVFNLARTDIAGYDGYARSVARLFRRDPRTLEDLLEGLFHIAAADGDFHPDEEAFLRRVWEIFGLSERVWRALVSRYAPDAPPDPYAVLGIDPGASDREVTAAWRRLVRETHPDRMIARGLPEEAVKLATSRLAAVNRAYEEVLAERAA